MIVKKWSIYRANLDPVVGSEQGKTRPVIIISEDSINSFLNIVNVIPVTSRKPGRKIYPNEVILAANAYGLVKESIALCQQIRTLDKARLSHWYGEISNKQKQSEIIEALCFQLGIDI